MKTDAGDLALLGGQPVFSEIRSTSNLVQPDLDGFLSYAKQSFDSGWLTNNGPLVKQMEDRFAALHQAEHCVAVCNGLWGIVLCIHCLAIKGRNEVIMPSFTYRRMADITAWLGLTPHFCDVDPDTLGMSAATVEPAISEKTALILGAHPIVNLCDIDGLTELSSRYEIPLLFDSVEAAYASHHDQMIGSFGIAECFSMHASKFLNGFEAGYITTNNADLAQKLRTMRAFGFIGENNVAEFGLNAKLNEFHAAMALASLDDLDDQVDRNRERARVYRELLDPIPGIELLEYESGQKRSFKNVLVELTSDWPLARETTLRILHAENMLARPYYFPPLHAKKTQYPTITGSMTHTEHLQHRYLLLPSGDFVTLEDIELIAELLSFLQQQGSEVDGRMANGVRHQV